MTTLPWTVAGGCLMAELVDSPTGDRIRAYAHHNMWLVRNRSTGEAHSGTADSLQIAQHRAHDSLFDSYGPSDLVADPRSFERLLS